MYIPETFQAFLGPGFLGQDTSIVLHHSDFFIYFLTFDFFIPAVYDTTTQTEAVLPHGRRLRLIYSNTWATVSLNISVLPKEYRRRDGLVRKPSRSSSTLTTRTGTTDSL
jgi:hypothetical protein